MNRSDEPLVRRNSIKESTVGETKQMAKEQTVNNFSDVAPKSEKPDFKLSEMNGQRVTITEFSKKDTDYMGKPTTFFSITMANGKRASVNKAIYEQLVSVKDKLPVVATFTAKKGSKGTYYVLA